MAERNDCPSSDLNPLTCNGELDEELDNNATSENQVNILAVEECKLEKNVEIIGVHDLATCQLCFLCKQPTALVAEEDDICECILCGTT